MRIRMCKECREPNVSLINDRCYDCHNALNKKRKEARKYGNFREVFLAATQAPNHKAKG